MSRISVKDAVKRYGNNTVIPDLNLEIGDGELFTLLGPSGCGKTTLLRMIAGFNSIEGGDIFFNEKRINDMDPSKRNIGMVFQNYAIFPNLSVRDNVAFGLKNRKVDKAEIKKRTDEFLNLMQIMQYADRMPNQLSGGQQQRIALARALVISPDVLLMDEPVRAVRRPAAARCNRSCDRFRAASAADGRAAFQSGRKAPCRDAQRHPPHPEERWHHHRVCHPRSGRGNGHQ